MAQHIHIDVRTRQIEDWLRKEGEYSDIVDDIKNLLEKLDSDALSNEQWEDLTRRIDRLNEHAKRVSKEKQDLARAIAGYPTR